MNYKRIYSQIINNRLANPLPESEYGQKHHILPKSLYPKLKKEPSNIVRLTYREHYICHWLLTKFMPCKQMTYAFWLMNNRKRYFNSYAYTQSRKEFIKANNGEKNPFYNKTHSEETKQKLREVNSGEKNPMFGRTGANHPNYGTRRTEEQKRKIGESCKGKNKGEKNGMYGKGTRIWINNGLVNNLIKKDCPIPEGYILGRIKKIKEI